MQCVGELLLVWLVLSAPGASRALSLEPRYNSQFQYDEQLLEKMIRMEGEMDKWETRMNEKLEQIASVQEQVNQLTESLSKTYFNLTDMHSKTELQIHQFIENFKSETGATPNVLFKARRVQNETPSTQEVIVFKDVLYNFGSGYDSSSGVFTTPVNGTYLFTARLLSTSGGSVFFEINVDGSMNSNGALYNHDSWSYATADSVVRLLPGQKVCIKSLHSIKMWNAGLLTALDSKSNEFTGVLLHF